MYNPNPALLNYDILACLTPLQLNPLQLLLDMLPEIWCCPALSAAFAQIAAISSYSLALAYDTLPMLRKRYFDLATAPGTLPENLRHPWLAVELW